MTERHRAFLGHGNVGGWLPCNPDSVEWGYRESQASFDTLGGRVVQLLGVDIEDMVARGAATSRAEMVRVARLVKGCMTYHLETKLPVHFKVPSRGWDFLVYVEAMPKIGWDVRTVEYPYMLSMKVQEDLGVTTPSIITTELARIAKGIGYTDMFHGGDDPEGVKYVYSYIMGFADTGAWKGGSADGGATSAADAGVTGTGRAADMITWQPSGADIEERIRSSFAHFFGDAVGNQAVCIAKAESGLDPTLKITDSNDKYSYGLFQLNAANEGSWWWPSNPDDLLDVEVNIDCAMVKYKELGKTWCGSAGWSTAAKCVRCNLT